MINICLCDDDMSCIEMCKRKIEEYAERNKISIKISEFSSGDELLFHMYGNENLFDVMFLDIIMKGTNGIDTAKELRKKGYKGVMIFLTSSKQYAIKSFEVEPHNYVLKDEMGTDRFQVVLAQAFAAAQRGLQKRLIISTSRSSVVIELNDIIYIESSLKKILIYTKDGKVEATYTLDESMKKVGEYGFLRCHKSFVVNSRHIKSYNKNEIVMANGVVLPIGRAYTEHFTKGFLDLAVNNVLFNKE